MMSRMKELEDENRRLKKMYLEEKLKVLIGSCKGGLYRTGILQTFIFFCRQSRPAM